MFMSLVLHCFSCLLGNLNKFCYSAYDMAWRYKISLSPCASVLIYKAILWMEEAEAEWGVGYQLSVKQGNVKSIPQPSSIFLHSFLSRLPWHLISLLMTQKNRVFWSQRCRWENNTFLCCFIFSVTKHIIQISYPVEAWWDLLKTEAIFVSMLEVNVWLGIHLLGATQRIKAEEKADKYQTCCGGNQRMEVTNAHQESIQHTFYVLQISYKGLYVIQNPSW